VQSFIKLKKKIEREELEDKMSKHIANFKNFAKLKDTDIAFNDITVIAGKPSTGKSYVMKFMYAIDESICSILDGSYIVHYALEDNDINNTFTLLKQILSLNKTIDMTVVNELINNYQYSEALLRFKIEESKLNDKDIPLEYGNDFIEILDRIIQNQNKALSNTNEEKFHFIFRNILESIFGSIEQISGNFSYKNKYLDIGYIDNSFKINRLEIEEEIKSASFVETPLILEFEKFLPKEKFKTPYHIDSLIQELNKSDYFFTSDETSEFINKFKTSSKQIINGNISKGSQGFSFESNGKSYNIINTSSGTKSIGLLQYLVTNKVLKRGSVLYWEEPEVHLHPQWQLKMVELFVELMNGGIKIVFSTHSPYMADYLNAISKKRKFDDKISFNLFKEEDRVAKNIILDEKSWDLLQDELLGTLEDIVWEYL
jgi:predicted ATPase